nr:hypothetical protein [uncultured Lichenicoccus sp.]
MDALTAWEVAHPAVTRSGDVALVVISVVGLVITLRGRVSKARGWMVASYVVTIILFGWSAISGPW